MTTADLANLSSTTDSPASNQPATRHKHRLAGCSPTPLAHYLKALAVLRLVCEQADPTARGFWRRDDFVLDTALDRQELLAFFLNEYRPTPLITPWNGNSGFYGSHYTTAISALTALKESNDPRFLPYREVLKLANETISAMDLDGAPKNDEKDLFITSLRNDLRDDALGWIDAAFVMTRERRFHPPLLGTGGNDANLDFVTNFISQLIGLFDVDTGRPREFSDEFLNGSLWGSSQAHLPNSQLGQFYPHSSSVNPWDYVLCLEGTVLFAAASVKRNEIQTSSTISVPFCVRSTPIGAGSTTHKDADDDRPEMWMPLWRDSASLPELRRVISEGRITVGKRHAEDAVDFARAVSQFGVDRGVDEFVRYAFHERNGDNHYATPLSRIQVRRRPETDVIDEIDAWLDRFTGKARSDKAPAAVKSASQSLREAIFSFCRTGSNSRLTAVLAALGGCERVLARRTSWATDNFVRPLAGLSQQWLRQAYDGSAEFRLAASLASVFGNYSTDARPDYVPFRSHLEPIDAGHNGYVAWDKEAVNDVTWHDGEPVDALNAVMRRRLIIAGQAGLDTWPDRGRWTSLADIAAFTAGRIDLRRLAELLWGLMLVDWRQVDYPVFDQLVLDKPVLDKSAPSPADSASADNSTAQRRHPGALYALLKLCFAGRSLTAGGGESVDIPLAPVIHRHAADGQGGRASRQAARRLRASGVCPAMRHIRVQNAAARRTAAALLFPISTVDLHYLKRLVVDTSDN